MAKFKYLKRLYPEMKIIHAEFRAHQATILQLATRYRVGQESMRKFLMTTLGEEYPGIVIERRAQLRLNNQQAALKSNFYFKVSDLDSDRLSRTMKDFSEGELKELKRKIEQRAVMPEVSYHPYIVSPLQGDL